MGSLITAHLSSHRSLRPPSSTRINRSLLALEPLPRRRCFGISEAPYGRARFFSAFFFWYLVRSSLKSNLCETKTRKAHSTRLFPFDTNHAALYLSRSPAPFPPWIPSWYIIALAVTSIFWLGWDPLSRVASNRPPGWVRRQRSVSVLFGVRCSKNTFRNLPTVL